MSKLMFVVSMALVTAALAVPSTASAVWTSGSVHIPAGTNPHLHAEGTWQWSGPTGGLHCLVTATLQLTGGTTTVHMQEFNIKLPTCTTTGGLSSCTINAITSNGFPWTGHASGSTVTQTGMLIQNHLSGLFCPPTLQVETTASLHPVLQPFNTAGTGNRQGLTGFHIGGGLKLTSGGSDLGTVTPSGTLTLTASDGHKYGWT